VTGKTDNFPLLLPFSDSFAEPPDKLAEALIFRCEFLMFLKSRKIFFGQGREFWIQFILVTVWIQLILFCVQKR